MTSIAGMDAFFDAAHRARVLEQLPDGVSVTFDLRGEDGGVWPVSREGPQTRVEREATERYDCRLTCSVPDFRALVRGDLDPLQAFAEGRFEVEGDVGLVLRLHRKVL